MKTVTALFLLLVFLAGAHLALANPSISGQPASRSNNVGDNAQFTVTATGSGTLQFQWKFNGGDIASATTSVLNVSVVDSSKAGSYSVVVTDNNGPTTSADAVLSIPFCNRLKVAQWNFNSNPPDASTGTGSTDASSGSGTYAKIGGIAVTFTSGSASDPAASDNSAWRAETWGGATSGNKLRGVQFNVSSVNYQNLVVTWEQKVQPQASKYFRLQYTLNGTDWINHTVHTMNVANNFVFQSSDLSGISGANNNPQFAVRLLAEYEKTALGSGYNGFVQATGSSYWGADYVYLDQFTFLGAPYTEEPPVIVTQPQSQINYVGADVLFSVTALHNNLQYQWRRSGADISGATSSSLLLSNLKTENAGTYSVRVSNAGGSATSDDAVLTVLPTLPAGDRYWSGDGVTVGGAGTWEALAPRWGLAGQGPFNLSWNNNNLDRAVFAATGPAAGAVTLGSSVTVNKLTVTNTSGASTYSFKGANTLTFAGDNAELYLDGVPGTTSNVNSMNMSCKLAGPVVIKNGGGRVDLNNTGNSVGRWIIQDGALTGGTADKIAGTGNPSSLVTDYFTLDGGGLGFAVSGSITVGANRGIYLGPTAGNKLGCQDNGTVTFNGPITGPGSVSFPGYSSWPGRLQGSAATFVFSNPANDYQGGTSVATGVLRCGAAEVIPDTTTLTLTSSARFDVNGFTETFGSVVVNGDNARLQDGVGGGLLIAASYDMRVGGAQTAVLAGAATLTKTTTNSVELTGANTYSGGTVIELGTLLVNNTSGSGTGSGGVTINGGTLAGIGIISGVVTVNAGGTVSPGPGIGTLTLGSSPSLGGNLLMEVSTASTPTSDKLVVNGALAYGGTLTLNNIGPALVGGETFALFEASGGLSGAFTSIIGSPGPGLNYWGGNLTTDGTVYVNRAPVGGSHSITTRINLAITVSANKLKAGDSDPDGNALSVTAVSDAQPAGASVSLASGVITYDPGTATGGPGSFNYTLADDRGGSTLVSVSVTITDGSSGGVSPNIVYGPTKDGGDFVVRFAGIPGAEYTVEWADDSTGPWTKKENLTAPQTDTGFGIGVFEVRETTAATSRYYRTVYPSY